MSASAPSALVVSPLRLFSKRLTAVVLSTAVLFALLFTLPTPAEAATITVQSGCTLAQAITAANTNAGSGSCTPGSSTETDVIVLTGNITLTTGLPTINSDIIIEGNGYTIRRSPTAFNFRLFNIDGINAHLTINEATLTNGNASGGGAGGAFYIINGATVILNNSVVSDNMATGSPSSGQGGAVFLFGAGSTLVLNDSTLATNSAQNNAGGAIWSGAGTHITLNNSTVISNTASGSGGGIYTAGFLTVTNSLFEQNESGLSGGSIWLNQFATTNISQTQFLSNTAQASGGAMLGGGVLTIVNSTFRGNEVVGFGGGAIRLDNGILTLQGSEVVSNTAVFGGGLRIEGADTANIIDSHIHNNTSTQEGGGISSAGIVHLTNSTVSDNQAGTSAGAVFVSGTATELTLTQSNILSNTAVANNGGGLWVSGSGSNVTIERSTIMSNTASESGGGAWFGDTTADINRSTIAANTANQGNGGGIRSVGTLTLTNSTVSGNQTTDAGTLGGGLFNGGTMTINSSTITRNWARGGYPGGGGGIGAQGTGAVTTLNHSLVVGNNSDSSGSELSSYSTVVNLGNYNFFGVSWQTTLTTALYFSPSSDAPATIGNSRAGIQGSAHEAALYQILDEALADNGGGTLTHNLVPGEFTYVEAPPGSGTWVPTPDYVVNPALDMIPAANCLYPDDQRGVSRPQDGSMDGIEGCDAGAVEYTPRVCGILGAAKPATYLFGGLVVTVQNAGTDFDCLDLERVNGNHPNGSLGIQTGQYWRIDGLHWNLAGPPTQDYLFDLTLPYGGADVQTRVCRWLDGFGSGAGWDCGPLDPSNPTVTTDFVAGQSVTRYGLGSFSEWAVGQNVNPTAVSLQTISLSSPTQTSPSMVIWLTAVLTLTTLAWFWHRRKPEAS